MATERNRNDPTVTEWIADVGYYFMDDANSDKTTIAFTITNKDEIALMGEHLSIGTTKKAKAKWKQAKVTFWLHTNARRDVG